MTAFLACSTEMKSYKTQQRVEEFMGRSSRQVVMMAKSKAGPRSTDAFPLSLLPLGVMISLLFLAA